MSMLSQRANVASILSLRTGFVGIVDLIEAPMIPGSFHKPGSSPQKVKNLEFVSDPRNWRGQ